MIDPIKELAEKIYRDTCYGWADTVLRGDAPEKVVHIESLLREAINEARKTHDPYNCPNVSHGLDELNKAYTKGKTESLIRAAEVARDHGKKCCIMTGHFCNHEIAAAIEKLGEEK